MITESKNVIYNESKFIVLSFLVFLFLISAIYTSSLYDSIHSPKNLTLIVYGLIIAPWVFFFQKKTMELRVGIVGFLLLIRILYIVLIETSSLHVIEFSLLLILCFFVVYQIGNQTETIKERKIVVILCATLFFSGIVLSFVGYYQFFQSYHIINQSIKTAVVGTFGSSNAFGNWLGISIVGGFFLFRKFEKNKIILAGMVCIFICLILTESRGALVSLFLAGLVWVGLEKKRTISFYIYGSLFLILTFLSLVFVDIDSSTGRLFIWEISIQMLKENYITGVGIGNFGNEFLEYQGEFLTMNKDIPSSKAAFIRSPHNEYLQAFVEGGVIGGGLFLAITIFHILNLVRGVKSKNKEHFLVSMALSTMIIVHSFIDSILHFTPQMILFYFLIGLSENTRTFSIKPKKYISIPFFIILTIYSSSFLYHQVLGRYNWKKGIDHSGKALFSISVPYFEKSLKYIQYGELYFHYGAALVHNGSPEKGIYFLEKASDTFLDKNLFLSISEAFIKIEEYEKAIDEADKVLFYYPDLLAPHLLKGRAYYHLEEFDKSKEELLKCIRQETAIKSKDTEQIAREALEIWQKYGY